MIAALRWAWRQLTSMRTALMLLMLLAVAAIPGSIWPQRSVDSAAVDRYFEENPDLAPVLDAIGMFDVYASPWFASIYLLLFTSLVGCIIPRTRVYWRGWRQAPPLVPRRLTRLPGRHEFTVAASAQETADEVGAWAKRRRYRARRETAPDGTYLISTESGRLRELGNLVFHTCLVGVLISIAVGYLFGWKGEVLLVEGESFTSTASRYDTLSAGPLVDTGELPIFSLDLNSVEVRFEDDPRAGRGQFGAPREFVADLVVERDGESEQVDMRVNGPVDVGGARAYLLGNGYAPAVTLRGPDGEVLFQEAVPFLVQDNNYSSVGAIKIPATGAEEQLGLAGLFLPTMAITAERGPHSRFPALVDPALVLSAWTGTLFPGGAPQSVFELETDEMTQVQGEDGEPARILLRPGETISMPDGSGELTFDEARRFAGLAVRHDPGQTPVLIFSLLALGGLVLSLSVRRRRSFWRVAPAEGGARVEVAGLARGHDPALVEAVPRWSQQVRERLPGGDQGSEQTTDEETQ